MPRWISSSYRNDLAALRPHIAPADHAALVELAERIQHEREFRGASSIHLDELIADYADLRRQALTDAAGRSETLGPS